jgi:hypothetical protein
VGVRKIEGDEQNGKLDVNTISGTGENRSVSLVAHAHPVPCVEGVSLGDTRTRVRVPVEDHLDTLDLRASGWPIAVLALLETDFGKHSTKSQNIRRDPSVTSSDVLSRC